MSAGVLSSTGFFMVMLWRPKTACEIRDMCRAVRAFAISFASFCSRFRSRLFVALNLDCEAKLRIVYGAKYMQSLAPMNNFLYLNYFTCKISAADIV